MFQDINFFSKLLHYLKANLIKTPSFPRKNTFSEILFHYCCQSELAGLNDCVAGSLGTLCECEIGLWVPGPVSVSAFLQNGRSLTEGSELRGEPVAARMVLKVLPRLFLSLPQLQSFYKPQASVDTCLFLSVKAPSCKQWR